MFSMERVSNKDPEELLREISQNVCINDLGTSSILLICFALHVSSFELSFIPSVCVLWNGQASAYYVG
jgi:hypothetical protein